METFYDVVIVGGGPAGLTAAIYLARAKYRVLVLEKLSFGGQIAITEEVENYPGLERVSGMVLTETMRRQAESFGAEFQITEVTGFDLESDRKRVRTTQGVYSCFAILLATGAQPRTVGFLGEEAYKGRGVSYCATCDGAFFNDKEVFVIGGGYAAAEESVFLTKFARHVTILMRKDDFSCAKSVADKARNHEKITIKTNTVMEEVSGENRLTYVRYRNTLTGEITEYRSQNGDYLGVFVLAGYAPATSMLKGIVDLNDQGYILTDETMKTSVRGVYAAGDVCVKPLRQLVTATSDGALAATELETYVAAMQQKAELCGDFQEDQKKSGKIHDPEYSETRFSPDMIQQLTPVFDRMENNLILKLYLDHRPVSGELERFMAVLTSLSDKLSMLVIDRSLPETTAPCVQICREDGSKLGIAFHGVPGGHEFTSFILGLYNAAGPGQAVDSSVISRIASIQKPVNIKVLITLSCTMCPDTVAAAQKIAAMSSYVTTEVYDISHFEAIRNQYNVMSVPCLVINEEFVSFGKKGIEQILDLIQTESMNKSGT